MTTFENLFAGCGNLDELITNAVNNKLRINETDSLKCDKSTAEADSMEYVIKGEVEMGFSSEKELMDFFGEGIIPFIEKAHTLGPDSSVLENDEDPQLDLKLPSSLWMMSSTIFCGKDGCLKYIMPPNNFSYPQPLCDCETGSPVCVYPVTYANNESHGTESPKNDSCSIPPKIVEEVKNLSVFTKVDAYVLGKIKEIIGDRRMEPKDWACLMAVLDDYGLLYDRNGITGFVRAMMALGIIPELDKRKRKGLGNSIWRNLRNYDKDFRSWKPNMKSIKDYCYNLAEVLEKSDGFNYRN